MTNLSPGKDFGGARESSPAPKISTILEADSRRSFIPIADYWSVMARIYVGNLDPRTTARELEDEFRVFGVLRSVWVARKPPGFAFIDFDDRRDAQDAIRDLDGVIVLVIAPLDSVVHHLVGVVIASLLLMIVIVLNRHILMDIGVAGAENGLCG
ncbi:hypothetical protein C4D60_Mb08t25140 [Musa balbisiana]|uniref:RRM domain-containing protein n=1 Tax=Musa balbisiana TaxID=52838 RepID=A0A4S8K6C1_MUSBA|nr:hypothetical protein C4D60_Mb08t25140 [Musa balbisiana]